MKIQRQEQPILEKSIFCHIRIGVFPLQDVLPLRAMEDGLARPENCRRVAVAVAVVGVMLLSARFATQKLHKILYLRRIQGATLT